jgi:hypothetical protein
MIKYITNKTYQALTEDTHIKCSNGIGASKVILPLSNTMTGKRITVSKVDSGANAVTIHVPRNDTLVDGTLQVETATVVGTVTKTGNATVVVTAANIDTSPITLSVAVTNTDTATIVAGKIATALRQNAFIGNADTGLYTVTNSGATVTITSREYYANDATLNISIDNGTCTGLTTAATSANTTAGVSVTISTQNEYKTFASDGNSWVVVDASGVNTTETLTNKTLTSPVITAPDLTFGVASHSYASGTTAWTLSATELKATRIIVTLAGGAVDAIATPTAGKMYIILNTSGQALTFKATGQSGVTIANTKSAIVIGNGTDFVRVTADC